MTLCTNDTMAVLLQTACTYVYSPTTPQLMVEVRVLMDGGSQWSYICISLIELKITYPSPAEKVDQDLWIRARR